MKRSLLLIFAMWSKQVSKRLGMKLFSIKGLFMKKWRIQVKKMGIKKLGFEQDHMTFATYKAYERPSEVRTCPVQGLIENLRLIKTPSEIKILKEAADIADAAFKHIFDFIRPGITELEVSNEFEFFMRKEGATSSSFDIIVASGYRSACHMV